MWELPGYDHVQWVYQGAGVVTYRAREKSTGRPVWIKATPPRPAAGEIERLRRECAWAARVAGAGFPAYPEPSAFGDVWASVAPAAETGEGQSLRRWLAARGGRLPVVDALRVGLSTLAMLERFHRHRLAYNHASPEALWFDPVRWAVTPVDFGFVCAVGDSPSPVVPAQHEVRRLAYLSPELTGRPSPVIDHRSDYYLLGILLYELLTGDLPLRASDPLEWLHAHVAREVTAPDRVNPEIPAAVSRVVMKCLAKSPGERYQSSGSLRADLEACCKQARTGRWLAHFTPAAAGAPAQFRLADECLGRDGELAVLADALARAEKRPPAPAVLISGEPGIGKTRLVQEFRARHRSNDRLFLTGKFDPVSRDQPFRAWIDAFHHFVRFVAAQGEEAIESWRRAIVEALGPGVPVLTGLAPKLEVIVGPQPPAGERPAGELVNRFESVLIRFLQLFAARGYTVVLFLDDLQWADPASLNLFARLAAREDLARLLLIGAYRDVDGEDGERRAATLARLAQGSGRVRTIHLGPMRVDALQAWLATTLHRDDSATWELALALHRRTRGNPFFVRELLLTLYADGWVRLDSDRGEWTWDLKGVGRVGAGLASLNLASLLVARLGNLDPRAMRAVAYASCLGNHFDVDLLAALMGETSGEARRCIDAAVREGLVTSGEAGRFTFAHDRVRTAAYSLLGEEERARLHARIGLLLLAGEQDAAGGERLFEIVGHLNAGRDFLERDEKKRLAALNLAAGRRAKANAAFDHARTFFRIGVSLLDEEGWRSDYDLIFPLTLGLLEGAEVAGERDEANRLFAMLLERAASRLDRARVYLTQIGLHTRADRYSEAIALGRRALGELGVIVPKRPTRLQLLVEWLKLPPRGRSPAWLVRLGPSADEERRTVMDIIFSLGAATYVDNPDLMSFLALRSCRITAESGAFHNSPVGIAAYAAVYTFITGNVRKGLALGDAAWHLAEKYGDAADKAYTAFMLGAFLVHWGRSPALSEEFLERSVRHSVEAGDMTIATYGVAHLIATRHVRGVPLADLARDVERYWAWTKTLDVRHFAEFLILYRQFVRNLQGLTRSLYDFDEGDFSEAEYVRALSDERKRFDYLLCKMQVLYLYGRYDEAAEVAEEAERAGADFVGLIAAAEKDFYYALILLGRTGHAGGAARRRTVRAVRRKLGRLRRWARTSPAHFVHKCRLLEAELARLSGRHQEAAALYQEAVDGAAEHGYLQNEAIAHERAAEFYRERGNRAAYERHLVEAWRGYTAWGALSKAHLLRREHAWLDARLEERGSVVVPAPQAGLEAFVDMSAVLEASQAISEEIVLDDLLKRLMHLILLQAGADRGALLLPHDLGWGVAARAWSDGDGTECRLREWTPYRDSAGIAHAVVDYVLRTRELVVLDSARSNEGLSEAFARDPRLASGATRSVLCLPISRQNELVGVVYLENSQFDGAFTPRRVEVLRLLTAQIAISIQNATLYDALRAVNRELEGAFAETAVSLEQTQREMAAALVEKAILEERNKLAGHIHDTVGHTLTSVLTQIEAGKKLLVRGEVERAMEKLDNSQRQIREELANLRRALHVLREGGEPQEATSLETFIQKTMEYAGIDIAYTIAPGIRLSPDVSYVFHRALQEGITNGIRHGKSVRFEFSLDEVDGTIRFRLKDDGKGAERIVAGFGLSAMQRRVEQLGGSLEIETAPGQGCTLTILIPRA